MKNLILVFVLFITINSYSQDTTIVFVKDTIEKQFTTVLKESAFITIDTIDFDNMQDSTNWTTPKWRQKDSIFVNPKTYKIKQVQFRMSDQGIKQRRARIIQYKTKTVIRRKKSINKS